MNYKMRHHTSTFLLTLLIAHLAATSLSAEEHAPTPIISLTLIDAERHTPIRELASGETINLGDLPTKKLNIRADTSEGVSRVDFQYDLQRRYRSESSAPFSLAGDNAGRYRAWTPTLGSHQIVAIPYSGSSKLAAFSLSFRVIDERSGTKKTEKIEAKEKQESLPVIQAVKTAPREVLPAEQAEKQITISPEARPSSSVFVLEQPTAASKSTNSSESAPTGKCVSFIDDQATRLTLGCSYTLSDPVRAHVALDLGDRKQRSVCDLGMPATPMVATCALTPEIAAGLGEGKLVLSIESLAGSGSSLQGRLGPLAINSAAKPVSGDLNNGGVNR